MPYYKFKKNDVLYNTIEAKPVVKFDINRERIYYNNLNYQTGTLSSNNITQVPVGHVSLYELNVDRNGSSNFIHPFITKDGSFETLQSVSKVDYINSLQPGEKVEGSYPLSASISRERLPVNHGTLATTSGKNHVLALQNTLNYYTPLSPRYAFSSDEFGDKSLLPLTLIYIPSIFYGSTIDRGSVDLKYFISGTLVARAQDIRHNGELVQTDGTTFAQSRGSNRVPGMVLYDEGIIMLTGSWNLSNSNHQLGLAAGAEKPTWITFGAGANDTGSLKTQYSGDVDPKASFVLQFKAVNYVETITMFTHVDKNELNYSTNKTFANYASSSANPAITGSNHYIENAGIPLTNTVSSSFYDYEERFKHQTFINKIGIYDEKKNLIAVANLATPIKKTAERDFTFKLKLDI
tara:strand:- start:36 stop:1256 length:1221 start_codon:yes stop_codon:yes gene_type:complete